MRFKFLIILILGTTAISAQQSEKKQITVKGEILEEGTRFPLEYAIVSFIDADGKIVTGGITDTEGHYNIQVPAGVYTVKYEFISYKTKTLPNRNLTSNTTLPTISLDMDSASLDEVVIRAETTEVQIRLDKKIYNIGKDLTSGGATVSDALSNVPSVTVDVDGAIALRGNENVKILINGKPSAIAGFGSTDALRQLPAEAIDRVEVITSPSARYDAEGTAGILNIILKKEKSLGINGSISATLGYPLSSNGSGNINIRTRKFNIFNTTSVYYRDAPGTAKFDNNYFSRSIIDGNGNPTTIDPLFDRVTEDRDNQRIRKGFNTNLGIEYFLTENSSITASGFYRNGKNNNTTTNNVINYRDQVIMERNTRTENNDDNNSNLQFALNYENKLDENGQKLTADLQYEKRTSDEFSIINNNTTFPDFITRPSERIFEDEENRSYLAQLDYVLPIGENAQFEAGYRGDFSKTTTDYMLDQEIGTSGSFIRNDSISNIFTYEQNVNAIYSQYGNKFGSFSFLLGLRLENTVMKGSVSAENLY